MHVVMENEAQGKSKLVKLGFSWPLFLFGWIYGAPLFLRGLHLHGAAVFAVCVFAVIAGKGIAIVAGFALIGIAIYYGVKGNELTGKNLLKRGWRFAEGDSNARYAKAQWGLPA